MFMRIYFSGIGGSGIGPLAQIALDAGYSICGSDAHESPLTKTLTEQGVDISLQQDGDFLREQHSLEPIDSFVFTAALPADHPELVAARELGIKTSKRDELLAAILQEHNIQLIAIAGTHGKTTTTAMHVWVAKQLGLSVSYLVGSTLPFGPSGKLDLSSPYFFYECDEYDRNFLHFSPRLSVITSLDYDHPDIYASEADYIAAFRQFLSQSQQIVAWRRDVSFLMRTEEPTDVVSEISAEWSKSVLSSATTLQEDAEPLLSEIALAGAHNRKNGALVLHTISLLTGTNLADEQKRAILVTALNSFPGTGRRFEKLADNLFSDYGHHPTELAATLQLAHEIAERVVLVYQPHQNTRQHHVKNEYKNALTLADKIYWLPTYLAREDASLDIITPEQFIDTLTNKEVAEPADLNEQLWNKISQARDEGALVLVMGAGTIDKWVRDQLSAEPKDTSTA